MSTEDFYQPLPNVVSIKKEIRLKFPKNPWNINSENNYWTSEDQTLALWGKEFKFGFESDRMRNSAASTGMWNTKTTGFAS